MKKILSIVLSLMGAFCLRAEEKPDYTKGVFILNEGWYGHQNSTINFLRDNGEWEYRVFQKENPGKELGCTSQFGVIFDNRLFVIISKQARDMGADVAGGRITVCDAKTMQCLKQIENIATDAGGNSIADGRAFVGVNPQKGYVSTNNGIYVFDLENLEVDKMIDSTGSADGGLYSNQCGTMLADSQYVFAIHQTKGLLVIDIEKDSVVRVIGAPVEEVNGKATRRGFGSIVRSKDGMMWLSVAADVSGRGSTVDYFFKFDPATFDTTRIALPEGYGLPSSWYAWTADAFCASGQQNKLYWKKANGGWFTNSEIVCYDIDRNEASLFFDTRELGWYIYCGAGFRVHPQTDEMYVSLYLDNLKQTYQTLRLNNKGEVLATYEMIDNYWFPALTIFPAASDSIPEEPENPDEPINPGDTLSNETHVRCGVSFYPNPAKDAVFAKGEYELLQVYDLTGRLQNTFRGEKRIDVRDWKPGVYFFRATDKRGSTAVYKIMIR
ncbi:MAG: DUF5074 domain-containing protein [Bacteroides sp.]|nr:DUF5074 domain-containing protein [Ruminococcus flavefaciens]MCM1554480.1 DUF5074 domain-containing protein [Bacteroides sp.]